MELGNLKKGDTIVILHKRKEILRAHVYTSGFIEVKDCINDTRAVSALHDAIILIDESDIFYAITLTNTFNDGKNIFFKLNSKQSKKQITIDSKNNELIVLSCPLMLLEFDNNVFTERYGF